MVAGGPGSRWRASMVRATSAEWTPWTIASAQAASTAGSPSESTAVRMSTICRLPSSASASLRRTRSIAAGKHPVFEGRTVTQGARLAGEHRHVMPRIVDRLATAERSRMFSDDPPVLADHDAGGIGMDFDRTPDGIGGHGVFVAVGAHRQVFDTAAG